MFRQIVLVLLCGAMWAGVCAGQAETGAAPRNEAKGLVQGKVVQDPGGQGIRKVRVVLIGGSDRGDHQHETTTDDAGQFKMAGLAPGIYAVQLSRPGMGRRRPARPS